MNKENLYMKIPMLDLSEQYQSLRYEIINSLDAVLLSSTFILGDHVKRLEQDVASLSNALFGVGVANGSDALHISLQACGVKPGDEVITTPFTFFATAGAIVRAGAKPVFVDIDPVTFNIDPTKIEQAITKNTRAIIPVHLYGQAADMNPILEIARKYNLYVVNDAAQAIGAEYKGKKVGELGHTTCFSFFPTKNLGAYGDGGMIVTKDSKIAEKMRIIRVHGSKPKYYHQVLGYNSRLDELQAAVLNIKLQHLARWNMLRREKATAYTKLLNEKLSDFIVTPTEVEGNYHVFHQYTIRVEKRDELQRFLQKNGVSTMVYYPVPLHLQPVFQELGYIEGDFLNSEKAAKEVLSLPMFPELKLEQQKYIVDTIEKFFSSYFS